MKLIDDVRRDNIALLVDECGSLVALANKLERDSSQVSQWLHGSAHSVTGKQRGLRQQSARYIEEKCGKPVGWLDIEHSGTFTGALVETSSLPGTTTAHGPYPLISDVQAGMWAEIAANFQRGDAEEWMMSAKNLGSNGYMLRVSGQSMEHHGGRYSFAEGMILHVNADMIDPRPGQFVIVRRQGADQAAFKRYVMIDGEPYLEAINPDWPKELRYLKLQPGDVFCGVVVDASMGNLP